MYVIAGLGNPGKKYAQTRHNMGFITVDQLAEKHDIKVDKLKFKALVGEGRIAGQKVLLVKPQTYMNLSGESIREVMHFYKLEPEQLIVIYDDIDLEAGALRIRKFGSAGPITVCGPWSISCSQTDFRGSASASAAAGNASWRTLLQEDSPKKKCRCWRRQ